MRDDPIEGESVVLIVTVSDGSAVSTAEKAIETVGGTIEQRLQFGALQVTIDQTAIEALCELDGIESIKTEHAVGIGGDAGEDIE